MRSVDGALSVAHRQIIAGEGRSKRGLGTKTTLFPLIALFLVVAWSTSAAAPATVTPELREHCVETLRTVLAEEELWVKVHAAESLLALSYPQGVREAFTAELEKFGSEPEYRIGIWRVLARASVAVEEKAQWVHKIRDAFLDAEGPDRIHAVETLAKLGYAIPEEERAAFLEATKGEERLATYAKWALAQSDPTLVGMLAKSLASDSETERGIAAYGIRHLPELGEATRAALHKALGEAEKNPPVPLHFLGVGYVHADSIEQAEPLHELLLEYLQTGTKGEKYQVASVLGMRGGSEDLPALMALLEDVEADVQGAAAHALLRIERRQQKRMSILDWAVIALYGLGMLAVGWYYARRTATAEDYLLGGRAMRPLAVGLSMFASLLSTLSYLAVPGEMIKHGPMIAGAYFVYPLTFLAIGWLIIPAIMQFKVTSAYEILEERLGLSVRMLGAFFFLALRMMWMAVIIYATSDKVLVPLLGWDERATPIVCAVLGLVTLAYTSMGGLRAVVMTDVAQTLILFGGAGLTLVLITVRMGGVGAWWPSEWAPNWDPFKIVFDTEARITIMGAMMASFIWYVCTAGSDQVAIQRYLSTRNTSAARRVLATSLISDVCVGTFLAILGLALFAYFTSAPHLLPDGQQIQTNADALFPRFIVMGLPVGISGLVVAGLLAAAMSSLSSGMNSSSSVLAVDFIERFKKGAREDAEASRLSRARWSSVAVGLVVIVMSVGVGQVGGNLLEIAYKVVNLLTAPLFVLFFMAFFVRWATAPGALAAGISSATVAIGIGYFHWFGLSFLWILPLALLTGVVVGPVVSLLPFGERKRGGEAGA